MTVEKVWDDLWIGVKGQSNSVIAGSLRNAFRCSVKYDSRGYSTDLARGPTSLPNHIKLRIPRSRSLAVRLWMLRSMVERERAQTVS